MEEINEYSTVAEIKEWLTDHDVPWKKSYKKVKLVELMTEQKERERQLETDYKKFDEKHSSGPDGHSFAEDYSFLKSVLGDAGFEDANDDTMEDVVESSDVTSEQDDENQIENVDSQTPDTQTEDADDVIAEVSDNTSDVGGANDEPDDSDKTVNTHMDLSTPDDSVNDKKDEQLKKVDEPVVKAEILQPAILEHQPEDTGASEKAAKTSPVIVKDKRVSAVSGNALIDNAHMEAHQKQVDDATQTQPSEPEAPKTTSELAVNETVVPETLHPTAGAVLNKHKYTDAETTHTGNTILFDLPSEDDLNRADKYEEVNNLEQKELDDTKPAEQAVAENTEASDTNTDKTTDVSQAETVVLLPSKDTSDKPASTEDTRVSKKSDKKVSDWVWFVGIGIIIVAIVAFMLM